MKIVILNIQKTFDFGIKLEDGSWVAALPDKNTKKMPAYNHISKKWKFSVSMLT
jgi:hypothetical protein